MRNDDSAVVIIATTGKETVRRAVESVAAQTYDDVRCLVVCDGPQFESRARQALSGTACDLLVLPQNTGADGYVCHRIYGATPLLCNADWIFYLDDDNWYEADHVRNLVKACRENGAAWGHSFRNIYHKGEFLCEDKCESLGAWPVWYDPSIYHVDTNCYCIRRDVAVQLAPHWHKSRIVDGKVQTSADTAICNFLRNQPHPFATVPQYTVNYELGSWELSPKPEFFLDGNERFAAQFEGVLPWA